MSAAKPHFVRVVDAPGQPARVYGCDSKSEAMSFGCDEFRTGYVGCVVKVYKGHPDDDVAHMPVKVWS